VAAERDELDDAQAPGEILHTYPMRPLDGLLIVPAALFGLAGLAMLGLWLIGSGWREWVATSALLWFSLSFLSVAVIIWRWLVWRRAMHEKAWVRLTDEGIAVCDPRGHEASLSWAEVRAMYWHFGVRTAPGPTLHIEGSTRKLHIPVWALGGTAGALIAKQIAERAGLRCVHMGGYDLGARYEA